jgi:hypothetical protein
MPLPTERVSFSNQNYRYLDRYAESRGISISAAANALVDDFRQRASIPHVKATRAVESGEQMVLFELCR